MIGRAREGHGRTLAAIAGDATVAAVSLAAIVLLRRNVELDFTRSLMPEEKFPLTPDAYAWFAFSLIVGLAAAGFYNRRVLRINRTMLGIAFLIQIAGIALVWTFLERPLPRTVLLGAVVIEALLLPLWHRLLALLWNGRTKPVILVGDAACIREFHDSLGSLRRNQLEISGAVSAADPDLDDVPWLGAIDAPQVASTLAAAPEVLFLSSPEVETQKLRLLSIRGPRGFLLLPSSSDAMLTPASFGWIGDQPLVEIALRCGYGSGAAIKRLFDLAAGTMLLLLSIPAWIATAIAIRVEGGGPVLIRQPRIGREGKSFSMWKFRTMRPGGDSRRLASTDDDRVTAVGGWLRRHRIDELPQLLNVLKGDMSLVGPRPEQPHLAAEIVRELPEFELRGMVRPGIAGLAQVSADYHTRPAVKLRYDLTYMQAWSVWLDLKILIRTISTVVAGRGV